MNPVFFLRHFNDIDHISPIMWECLEQADDVVAILLDSTYPGESDPRLQFLQQYDNFELRTIDDVLGLSWGKPMFRLGENDTEPASYVYQYLRRLLQKTRLSNRYAVPALREVNPTACIFEWGPPQRTSHAEFYHAATKLGIPRISVPHGAHIYTHIDIKDVRTNAAENGDRIMASRNGYDAYVEQSEFHKESNTFFGVRPDNHYLIGSARYYPEWQAINEEFYDAYEPAVETDDKLTVVFMLPHWKYHVDKGQTLQLLSELATEEWVHLIIKEHTRGDSLPSDMYSSMETNSNTEIIADIPSVSLIKESDAVINFGSSIGIEAFLQEKHHLYPSYLHSNNTAFDRSNAGHQPTTNAETVDILRDLHRGNAPEQSEANIHELYRLMIYGGREPFDVPYEYRALIESLSTDWKSDAH
ncbi:hypothetical protein [Halorubrum pallidum]|uniref:Uncharacterized protein n=1 Tax=Halorubrum pallidum TaxID=1526114 RepID=A0ABD5T335_9EURY